MSTLRSINNDMNEAAVKWCNVRGDITCGYLAIGCWLLAFGCWLCGSDKARGEICFSILAEEKIAGEDAACDAGGICD